MAEENTLITKPQELLDWLDDNDLLMNLSDKEAELLIGYMEGHGYALGFSDKCMVRVDMESEELEFEEYSIDDVIDTVCGWNYDMISQTEEKRDNPKDFIDFCESQNYLEQLRADEVILDKMFEKTVFGKRYANTTVLKTEEVREGQDYEADMDKGVR